MGRRKRRGRAKRTLGILILLTLLAAAAYVLTAYAPTPSDPSPPPATGELRVHYLDVGQGDATVWELPDGSLVVYDCGPPVANVDESPLVRFLRDDLGRPPGSRVHALIASHGHLDHVGGCDELFHEYVVERVFEAGYEGDDAPESYQRYMAAIHAEGAQLRTLATGLAPGVDLQLPGVRATLLWPRAFSPGGWDAVAEASLVVRLEHGAASFCFQGDIETQQERVLAESPVACDVLLVGHHGSRQASSAEWLRAMDPEWAVVSFGENAYGHPTSEALCRVQQQGAALYTTHRGGTVSLVSAGSDLRVLRGAQETKDYCAEGVGYWA